MFKYISNVIQQVCTIETHLTLHPNNSSALINFFIIFFTYVNSSWKCKRCTNACDRIFSSKNVRPPQHVKRTDSHQQFFIKFAGGKQFIHWSFQLPADAQFCDNSFEIPNIFFVASTEWDRRMTWKMNCLR